MNLSQCLKYIKEREKELQLINIHPQDSLVQELEEYFASQNVRITRGTTSSGRPNDIAVLSTSDTVLTIVSAATLRELIMQVPKYDSGIGIADTEYEDILAHLKETTFTSYDSKQLLYASHEIEDRARRVGGGTIHAGFQKISVMHEQEPLYRDLAIRGITVHAYGHPDSTPPDFDSGQIHAISSEEIAEMWFVVFDGGGTDAQKTALVAQEQSDNVFYGAWTYDAVIVDELCRHLQQTYLNVAAE